MKNYKLVICYDGTRYFGWERQPGKDTIQGKLEAVLSRMTNSEVEVFGAGRTDAGVHAKAMVASTHLETPLSPEEVRDYLNRYLPEDICVDEVSIASDRFHARYNAAGKLYTYTCFCGATKPVFNRKYLTVLEEAPNLEAMKKAASYLVGSHDYKAFCGNPKFKKSTVRVVDSIEIARKGSLLTMKFHGTGFLQNMVRIMTGTLLEVGKGKIPPDRIPEILASLDRQQAGPTAPPQGLCLTRVDY